MNSKPGMEDVKQLDQCDRLARKRDEFELPKDVIYLDGNSLGALPQVARRRAQQVVEQQWGVDLVKSWNCHDWISLPLRIGDRIGALIGAASGQTICCDSTSVNLFKVLHCAKALQPDRTIVLTQNDNFPADLYIAQGFVASGTQQLQVKPVKSEQLEQHLTTDIAVLMLTHVHYKSAAMHDMARLTRLAQEKGIIVIWDLAHSVGALPLSVDAWHVDFAVGCGYKYLNGGPGAPAFVYAAQRHHAAISQPLTGWMGHKAPFEFAANYKPAPGISQFLCGTPPVLSMSVLEAALQVFDGVELGALREKSVALTELFLTLIEDTPALQELELVSPRKAAGRGSHLAFSHPQAYAICQALIANKVICDFRAPSILRFGFAPLYLSFQQVWDSVAILAEIIASKSYAQQQYSKRNQVT